MKRVVTTDDITDDQFREEMDHDDPLSDDHVSLVEKNNEQKAKARKQLKENLGQWRAFQLPLRDGRWVVVHRYTKEPDSAKIQCSIFDSKGAIGDFVRGTLYEILEELHSDYDADMRQVAVVSDDTTINESVLIGLLALGVIV